MNLTYDDFKNGKKLYRGKLKEDFNVDGKEIFKLENGEFFMRQDSHILPIVGFFPEIEIFNINGKMVLIYLKNHNYTYIEKVKVIESATIRPFDGFEPGKKYELQNGQIWQQVNGPNAPGHHSSGHVKIINDKILMVDGWSFFPKVKLINHKFI